MYLYVECMAFSDRLLRERIRRNRSHQTFDYDEATYDGPLESYSSVPGSERLVVVANRLPVTCSKDSLGQWHLQVGVLVMLRFCLQTHCGCCGMTNLTSLV